MKIPPFCRNLGIFYHILGGLHRFCWETDEMERVQRRRRRRKRQRLGATAWEMLSLSTYAIGDLSMAFVLEGYFVGKF